MSEIEEKLARILVAEADRHEVPRFDPYRIAENAGRRMSWYRKPLVLLAGLLVVGGGATGVVVGAAGGGYKGGGDLVTVTFLGLDSSAQPLIGGVEQQVLRRAAAEGLKDVEARFSQHPYTLVVTGHAADVEKLKTLGVPGILQMRPVEQPPADQPPQPPCPALGTAPIHTDFPGFACAQDNSMRYYLGAANPFSYGVVAATAIPEVTSNGAPTSVWEVNLTFNDAGKLAFANLTEQAFRLSSQIAVCVDGVVYAAPTVERPITDGNVRITGTFTEQQAKLLAAELRYPILSEFENAQVTVSPLSTR